MPLLPRQDVWFFLVVPVAHEGSHDMKSEERHKLETNVLAAWIAQTLNQIKPYTRTIVTALAAVVVLIAGLIAWPRIRDRASASAWDSFSAAMSTGNFVDLERIAEDYPRTAVAHWALVVAADARLATACMQLFSDKVSAGQELRKTIASYNTVIEQSRDSGLRERALFGRARAYEAVSGSHQGEGELPKAIADYEQVVKEWPTGAYAAIAGGQLKRLKSQDTKVFYDKFAAYTPKRPVSKESEAGGKPLPFDSSSLPDDSSAEFSKLLNLDDLKLKGAKTPEKTEPAKAEPAKTAPAKSEPPKTASPAPTPPAVPTKSEPPKK
jgi:hypothetical protein